MHWGGAPWIYFCVYFWIRFIVQPGSPLDPAWIPPGTTPLPVPNLPTFMVYAEPRRTCPALALPAPPCPACQVLDFVRLAFGQWTENGCHLVVEGGGGGGVEVRSY